MSETQPTAETKPRETEFHLKLDTLPDGALSIEGSVILGTPRPRDTPKDMQMTEFFQALIPVLAHAIMQIGEQKRKVNQKPAEGGVHVGPWPGGGETGDDEEEEDDYPEPIV